MTDLMTTAGNEHVTLTPEQTKAYDESAARVKAIDAHIGRLRELDALNAADATPGAGDAESPHAVRAGQGERPEGHRVCAPGLRADWCATATSSRPREYAQRWNDSTPEVALALKAAVAPGTTTDATWAAPLVNPNIADDFLELLRPGDHRRQDSRPAPGAVQLQGARARPRAGRTGGSGESKPKPVTKLAFSSRNARHHEGRRDHRADRGAGAAVESVGRGAGAQRHDRRHRAVPRWAVHRSGGGGGGGRQSGQRSPTARRRRRPRPIRSPTSWG